MRLASIMIGLVVLSVSILLAYAATKSDTVFVQRTVVINAPSAIVFECINDLRRWPKWAPQDREDRTMVRTYRGPDSGVGATSDWTSKGNAGKGSMTIINAVPVRDIEIRVDFRAPFVAHNLNRFELQPVGSATKVTWSMRGTNVYLMKVMSIFINPDRMLGPHFESGLANLKAAAETDDRSTPSN